MDLISILKGNSQELTPALSKEDSESKSQTPSSSSTNQVQLSGSVSDTEKYKDAVQSASELKTSDGEVQGILGETGSYQDPIESSKYVRKPIEKKLVNKLKGMIIGDVKGLSNLLDYGKNLGLNTLTNMAQGGLAAGLNQIFKTDFSTGVWSYQNKKAILAKPLSKDDNDPTKSHKSKWFNTNSNNYVVRTLSSTASTAANYVLNRVNSIASQIVGSRSTTLFNYKKKTGEADPDWRIVSSGDKSWSKATLGSLNSEGKIVPTISASSHFKGYSDLEELSARVDRFYDFEITKPENLLELPDPVSLSYKRLRTKHKVLENGSYDNTEDGLVSFEEDGDDDRAQAPLDYQANINVMDTVRLQNGDSFDLGYFGSVLLTKRLDMIASITTTFIEDNELSVRTWLEKYKKYMYCSDGRSLDQINPYVHRPIYEGYYYIKFWYLSPSGASTLYSKTFLGVPNFDLGMTPNPSDVKMFQVNWDIIGEEPMEGELLYKIQPVYNNKLSLKDQDKGVGLPSFSNLGSIPEVPSIFK